MKLFTYSQELDLIISEDLVGDKKDYYIVVNEDIEEFVIRNQKFPTKVARDFIKNTLNKKYDFYLNLKRVRENIHCIYIDKSKFDKVDKEIKEIKFKIETPLEFMINMIDQKSKFVGKLYINIGETIFLGIVDKGILREVLKFPKEGYRVSEIRTTDFLKKSIIWMEE